MSKEDYQENSEDDSFLEELKEDYESWLWRTLQFYTDKEILGLIKHPSELLEGFPEDSYYDDYTWYDVEKYKDELLEITDDVLNDRIITHGS